MTQTKSEQNKRPAGRRCITRELLLTALLVSYFPLRALSLGIGPDIGALLSCILVTILLFAIQILAFRWGRKGRELEMVLGAGLLSALVLIAYALKYGPEYYKTLFHMAESFNIAFLVYRERFLGERSQQVKRLFAFEVVLLGAHSAWSLALGAMILTSTVPNAANALTMNVYNALMGISWAYLLSNFRSYRSLVVTDEGAHIGELDLGKLLPRADINILASFLDAKFLRRRCAELRPYLSSAPADEECLSCQEGNGKPSMCSTYRTLYNKALSLAKMLEALGVGTLKAENGKGAARVGWRLELEPSVSVLDQRTQTLGNPRGKGPGPARTETEPVPVPAPGLHVLETAPKSLHV